MANDTTSNSTPAAPSQPVDEFPGYPGLKIGDPVPGQPGTKIGDVIVDDAGNQWNWKTGSWDYANLAKPPSRDKGGIKPGDETPARDYYNPPQPIPGGVTGGGTPPTTTKREDGVITTSGGIGLGAFPGRPLVRIPGSTVRSNPIVELAIPPIVPEQPNVPILPQSLSEPKYIKRAPIEPPTVPIPARRTDVLGSPYMGYVNYDPDEILAAAMQSMGGRQARRSILNELR